MAQIFTSGVCFWYTNWSLHEPLPTTAAAVGVAIYQVNETAIIDYTYVARGEHIDSEDIFEIHHQQGFTSWIHRESNGTHDTFHYEQLTDPLPKKKAAILTCDQRFVLEYFFLEYILFQSFLFVFMNYYSFNRFYFYLIKCTT